MSTVRYPSLLQVNTRVWLTELGRALGRPTTLDDIPDSELDRLSEHHFDWIWLLSVWQTGLAAQQVSRCHPVWRREFQETLADLCDDDIPGSGFAITAYSAHRQLGGNDALGRLRERLHRRGMLLMLDFVPNHVGLGHPWAQEHPEFFIHGTDADIDREPHNYIRVEAEHGEFILAHGRDPHFPGWPDTLQLNYANLALQQAVIAELMHIATCCDGVRCDMAMLVLPDIFERTWHKRPPPFWPAAIQRVRERFPEFVFLAEVYWDLEWTVQQQGFDYAYDKRLYDRLGERHARPVREHLQAGLDYQDQLARFLENHDEPRAAAVFTDDVHRAAAVITYLSPGMRFFHQGQFEGRTKKISPHLGRGPAEATNEDLHRFYGRLLTVLNETAMRNGRWQLLDCVAAWDGNWTHDCFIAYWWQHGDGSWIIAVNYAAHQSQCFVRLPFTELGDHRWQLIDWLGERVFERNGAELQARGLYLDEGPWCALVLGLKRV